MIVEHIGSIVTGVLSGGATGLIGVALQQWGESRKRAADLEMVRIQHAQALDLRKLDQDQQIKLASLDATSAERLADIDAMARADAAASTDFQASFAHDRATYSSEATQQHSRAARWLMAGVDALRGIIRPGVTLYSLGLLTALAVWLHDLWARGQIALPPDQQHRLALEIVGTITYLATTTTVWWFGVRPASRR